MNAPNTTPCLGCKTPTTGSIGATGARWSFLCQPCKDKADADALQSAVGVAKSLATAFDAVFAHSQRRDDRMLPKRRHECTVCGGYGATEKGDGTLCMHCDGEGEVNQCDDCGHDCRIGEPCRNGMCR